MCALLHYRVCKCIVFFFFATCTSYQKLNYYRTSYVHLLCLQVVNYAVCGSAEEICASCSKLITFIDLAGHEKYLKTTVFGLTAHRPDAVMLVISASNGVGKIYSLYCCSILYLPTLADTTKEHFSFAIALGMRTFVVITKVDMCQEHTTNKVVEQVQQLLSSYKKVSQPVKSDDDVLTAAQNFSDDKCVT